MAKLNKPKFHLTWPPGSELSEDQVEIWIGSLTVAEYNEGLRLGALAAKGDRINDSVVESDSRMNKLFAERLSNWNLEDDEGNPLPTSLETINGLPNRWVTIMIREWFNVMTAVPTDSANPSNGSRQLAEASLGMAQSSQPLQNG